MDSFAAAFLASLCLLLFSVPVSVAVVLYMSKEIRNIFFGE